MKKSTKIRRNKKSLANLELAQGLTCVVSRHRAGVKLLSSLTSLSSLTGKGYKEYPQILELLVYERR